MIQWIRRYGLWIIFGQSLIAMIGSLYYGRYGDPVVNFASSPDQWFNTENGFLPCELCRYARILMYPIVRISLIGIIRKYQQQVIDIIIPMSTVWLALEIYHYTLQKIAISTSFLCTAANPCDALYVDYFGFITIPFLCGLAFLIILAVAVIMKKKPILE